jgi:serine/threonine-protein phosphatase 2A activator
MIYFVDHSYCIASTTTIISIGKNCKVFPRQRKIQKYKMNNNQHNLPTTVHPSKLNNASSTFNPTTQFMPTSVHPSMLTRRPNAATQQDISTTSVSSPQQQQQQQNLDPEAPRRRIFSNNDMLQWKHSDAYKSISTFIRQLCFLITNRKLTDIERQHGSSMSDALKQCITNLDTLEQFIDEYPATDERREMSRFGNLAFRDWFDRMLLESDQMQQTVLQKSDINNKDESYKYKELSAYWKESFGNRTRIDYGTGHELSFAGYMCCLAKLNIVTSENDAMSLVGILFPRYLSLMRKIQLIYKLEPAGSHGVWGLDDYQFLPFVFGSAQLEVNDEEIVPSSIHNERILNDYSQDYLYIAAIKFIHSVKKGPFSEHSPVLNDISGVLNWKKVNNGMFKMYGGEVLDKFVVVQHFLFGKLLSFEPATTTVEQ